MEGSKVSSSRGYFKGKQEGWRASNLQRCVDGGQTVGGKAIVNEFDGRWEVINDDTDVISRN